MTASKVSLAPTDRFVDRHLGPRSDDLDAMLQVVGLPTLDALVAAAIPAGIRLRRALNLPPAVSEHEALAELRDLADANEVYRSYLGLGYHDCVTPAVILRNILESPGWYTAYTPYQPEIAQGRLEALLNFQTMIMDLTGLEIANASLLDEGTAAAEAMTMCHALAEGPERRRFFVSEACHPQTIDVVRTRAWARGFEVVVGDHRTFEITADVFGALVQYPATDGVIHDYRDFVTRAHEAGVRVVAAADLLALTLLAPPGAWGADIAVGNTQRFGVPMGYGGPHAAYFATRDAFKRHMPGRVVGVSQDSRGQPGIRLAIQTREQHIRREKATSNVCTAQVLLAVMAAMYAVYHGPDGLTAIARRVHHLALTLAEGLRRLGYRLEHDTFFDTLSVDVGRHDPAAILAAARDRRINLRLLDPRHIGIALDETVGAADLADLFAVFNGGQPAGLDPEAVAAEVDPAIAPPFQRQGAFLEHPVFHRYHSETEMLRYLRRLESRDLSLTTSMIPLGSCTMKLNAAAEMLPITWSGFGRLHPFAPPEQAAGYRRLFQQLEAWLAEISGFAAVSLQPNAGSQGEMTGLLVIKQYHASRGQARRDVCLIPQSAHGTNPASAVMAGLRVVVVKTDHEGNVDLADLRAKALEHGEHLAAIMITYPSTHGIFEEGVREICDLVHAQGGQVYLDGANMNAMVGLSRPGDIGADVCHLNLHKTFSIPHGGGGPGMGPIGVAAHLAPFLPGHAVVAPRPEDSPLGAVSSAPWGSPSILPISWAYIRMMGPDGLTRATQVAILNANYVARRLEAHYPVLYKGRGGLIAHECIIDPRPLKALTGVDETDIAKRLMDYGFHAPTVSFPVAGTLMIEPTESESRAELDRFCDALIGIKAEIDQVAAGVFPGDDNPLKHAPHTADMVAAEVWDHAYGRDQAAYPAPWTREHKFWPVVGRIDSVYGDRHLVCACLPIEAYADPTVSGG